MTQSYGDENLAKDMEMDTNREILEKSNKTIMLDLVELQEVMDQTTIFG